MNRLPDIVADLDLKRIDEPGRVLSELHRLLPNLPEIELSAAMGVYGSCLRQIGRPNQALLALERGMWLAEKHELMWIQGDLTQRYAIAEASNGDFEVALSTADRSIALYAAAGDSDRIGRVLTNQGVFEFHLQRFRRARKRFESALFFLDPDGSESRFSALSVSALCESELGNHPASLQLLDQARRLLRGLSKTAQTKFLWAEGRIAYRAGSFETSERVFRNACQVFLETDQGLDAALATLELSKALLAQGKLNEATTTCLQVKACLFKIPENSAAAQIVRDVLIRCQQMQLTTEVLDLAASSLERERR